VTQNVDDLHERAGHRGALHVHGSLWRNRCARCGAERADDALEYPDLPRSPCCDTLERPGVVWVGEVLPAAAVEASLAAAESCDVVLVVGTSGVVQPAAGLVDVARDLGARVVDVNPEEDGIAAHHRLRLPAGEALPLVLA